VFEGGEKILSELLLFAPACLMFQARWPWLLNA